MKSTTTLFKTLSRRVFSTNTLNDKLKQKLLKKLDKHLASQSSKLDSTDPTKNTELLKRMADEYKFDMAKDNEYIRLIERMKALKEN